MVEGVYIARIIVCAYYIFYRRHLTDSYLLSQIMHICYAQNTHIHNTYKLIIQYNNTNRREDLINKFQEDMPQKFGSNRPLAEQEVDKLLMDGEMLDLYIKYSQRKAEDPNWEPIMPREESAVQKVIGFISQYAIYLVGGFLLKDVVVGIAKKNDVELPSWLDGGNTVLPSESIGDVAASGAAADTLVSSVHHLGDHIMV